MPQSIQFFLSGLLMGIGICGLHCSLLLAPLIARTSVGWRDGLLIGLRFGSGKLLVCAVYGSLAAVGGSLAVTLGYNRALSLAAGLFLALMGIWFLLYSERCRGLVKKGSPFLLGLGDGLVPCGPMTGFIFYIAGLAPAAPLGALYGLLFGLGTLIGPLIAVCGLTPLIWRRISRLRFAGLVLRVIGAAIYFLWAFFLVTL